MRHHGHTPTYTDAPQSTALCHRPTAQPTDKPHTSPEPPGTGSKMLPRASICGRFRSSLHGEKEMALHCYHRNKTLHVQAYRHRMDVAIRQPAPNKQFFVGISDDAQARRAVSSDRNPIQIPPPRPSHLWKGPRLQWPPQEDLPRPRRPPSRSGYLVEGVRRVTATRWRQLL